MTFSCVNYTFPLHQLFAGLWNSPKIIQSSGRIFAWITLGYRETHVTQSGYSLDWRAVYFRGVHLMESLIIRWKLTASALCGAPGYHAWSFSKATDNATMKFHGAEISILYTCVPAKKAHNATAEISRRATESALGRETLSIHEWKMAWNNTILRHQLDASEKETPVDFGMCVAREASPRNRKCPFYEGRHQFALEKYMGGGFIYAEALNTV